MLPLLTEKRNKVRITLTNLLLLFLLFFVSNSSFAQKPPPIPTLTVYCSNSFANDWMQIGHPIKRAFEFQCNCKLNLVILSDGITAVSKIALEGNKSSADIIIGLDSNQAEKAKESGLFAPSNVSLEKLNLPIEWTDEYFIPYNRKIWGMEPKDMSYDWVLDKLPIPKKDDILKALLEDKKDEMPHAKFYYPKTNDQADFIAALADGLNIKLNHEITNIENNNSKWRVNGEHFDEVINTMPLNQFGNVYNFPSNITNACKNDDIQ